MVVFNNKNFNWVQVTTDTGNYTCKTKKVDGERYFKFKKEWHKVSDYLYNKKNK